MQNFARLFLLGQTLIRKGLTFRHTGPKIYHMSTINWQTLLADLCKHKTLKQIAEQCGLASAGHAHDLLSGRQKKVEYTPGAKLVELHNKLYRRKK